MTTIRGVIRSYGAAVRRAERDQQRKAREAARRFKEQQKMVAIEDAREAVEDYNSYVSMLQSVHKNCTESIDWERIRRQPKPIAPEVSKERELNAEFRLTNFKPSVFDKLFGSAEGKVAKLEHELQLAKEKDKKLNDLSYEGYLNKLADWEERQEIVKGVTNHSPESCMKALEYFDPFADLMELVGRIEISLTESMVDINIHVNSIEIVPDYELSQTSTGKLSKKKMTKSKFNELYQDHVCSSVLRIAREVFAYLPVENIRINAMAELLNPSTGHLEKTPILSVIIPPATIQRLSLETIDPSDSMQNFVHNMVFSKSGGFKPVSKVELNK